MSNAGKSIYPKEVCQIGDASSTLQVQRCSDKPVTVRRRLPGNIILVHGVNDIGTSYKAIEEGLCEGLTDRLYRAFKPASYSNPNSQDKERVVDDPDALYYKRSIDSNTDSPIIPFYWGYREVADDVKVSNGQFTDRYGTRLDKDFSKGGGPFANATSTLPDMWNSGSWIPLDPFKDPLRPLVSAPGRMYMVLAAKRLAALVSMIRDFDLDETVSIVAHSQGCLITLLAQAMLLERKLRPADALILTHPPYSLVEKVNLTTRVAEAFREGIDEAMQSYYPLIRSRQNLHARLQTLINIVDGVAKAKSTSPDFAQLGESIHEGMVERWGKPDKDRDNRGKVYLYFCPEDMTVALENVQGIGWQGVPDIISGTRNKWTGVSTDTQRGGRRQEVTRYPLKELGENFKQRVFTLKKRQTLSNGPVVPILVGSREHDFPLRLPGEDDHCHVADSGRSHRAHLETASWPRDPRDSPTEQRRGIRFINAERLPLPFAAALGGNEIRVDGAPYEEVDQIDASVAVSSSGGVRTWIETLPQPKGQSRYPKIPQHLPKEDLLAIEKQYNAEQAAKGDKAVDGYEVVKAVLWPDGIIRATIREKVSTARLRWQSKEQSAKSFHSSIVGAAENHRRASAYDVAIGGGRASSDPNFHAYLCAVGDWRIQQPRRSIRTRDGVRRWDKFVKTFANYLNVEPAWRKNLLIGNSEYYSSGLLPVDLPLLRGDLWNIVISETVEGCRVYPR